MEAKVGDLIRVKQMKGEPSYRGKVGVVEHIDDIGQLHGTWGGLAIIPEEDEFEILNENRQKREIVWIPINEQLPPKEEDGEWLITLKWGRVTCASYYADEDGDYWRCLDRNGGDEFFVTDAVIAWAEMPKGYCG